MAHPLPSAKPTRVHVIGAGLAGLGAAIALNRAGVAVELYETAPQAGGRCRSYLDDHLGRTIDNGGHVVLGANRAVFDYLDTIGGRQHLREIAPAAFPFLDLDSGETWTVRPNAGKLPWWVLSPSRRVAGTRARDYWDAVRLAAARSDATVAEAVDPSRLIFKRLWEPLACAVMNASPAEAAAQPLGHMLRATFGRGEAGCRPWIARAGLSKAFVDPALAMLARGGCALKTGRRLSGIEFEGARARRLRFGERAVDVAADEAVILAVSRPAAASLLPTLGLGDDYRAIVNAHFRLDRPAEFPGGLPLLGLVGGLAQWLIAHGDIVAVTVSAADAIVDRPADELVARLWVDVARALGCPRAAVPPCRLIKEKRATFAQTPAGMRTRPAARTSWRNLALAGDWTATGLPATIEGALTSGHTAASVVLAPLA